MQQGLMSQSCQRKQGELVVVWKDGWVCGPVA
jgi:hypothetical protein